jgi:hypothetical protein
MNNNQEPLKSKILLSEQVKNYLKEIWKIVDFLGSALMGYWWKDVYLSIQDAIGMSMIFRGSGYIWHLITDKNFSSVSACLKEDPFDGSFYACFTITTLSMITWAVIPGRILGRFLASVKKDTKVTIDKGDKRNG